MAVANRWLTEASPGERVAADAGGSAMGTFPGYYTFDTTRGVQKLGFARKPADSDFRADVASLRGG